MFNLLITLTDAIDICLSRMYDIQLAIVITRLYEGDMESVPPGLKKLLHDHVLNSAESSEPTTISSSSDPFLRSMSYWLMAQYTDSLSTLLERRSDKGELTKSQNIASPSVFNFYIYLRNHPLIIRQQLAMSAKGSVLQPLNCMVFQHFFLHAFRTINKQADALGRRWCH